MLISFRERDLYLNESLYFQTLNSIKMVFDSGHNELRNIKELAQKIKEGIEEISPFIQQSTEIVCQSCPNVCCINKHGYYSYEDLIYIHALGLKFPLYDFKRGDSDPCQFLSQKGCVMERSVRPSGCNWYFCEDLLDHMEKRSDYGIFDRKLTEIAELWLKMIDKFNSIIDM